MFYANQHAANDVMKDFCRQKGRLSAWLLGAAPRAQPAQILHVWRGWQGGAMGGLRLAQMTMLENGWSVQAKKMTDTVGHYRVGRSAAWE